MDISTNVEPNRCGLPFWKPGKQQLPGNLMIHQMDPNIQMGL